MSLKKKTILMVCAVFFISGALNLLVQQFAIMPSFHELERDNAIDNMGRVLETINRELQTLGTSASDWAYWDDLYHYAAGEKADFLETTLNQSALENAKVNLMNVYDPAGKLLWGRSLDLESGKPLNFGGLSTQALPANSPLGNLPEATSEVSGFFRTSQAPLMLAAKHILTNERTGPANGIFALGRLFDESAIKRMADQIRLQLAISVIPDGEAVADWRPVSGLGVPHSPILLKEDPETLTASTIVADIHGRPLLRVSFTMPMDISARGESAVLVANVSIGAAGLLVMALLLFMLHRTILNPLAQLTGHSRRLGETDDLFNPLAYNRKDEIGVLANAFDQMIARLAETRHKLVDQSFHSGIAEMASGVLHNIGNAVTPLQVQTVALHDELRTASVADMQMAALELADGSTAAERRIDLASFVKLAGNELADTVGRALEHVAGIDRQVQYIKQILTDQEHYSRAVRALEPLNMEAMVLDSAQTLAAPLRDAMTIDIDPSVGQVGPVIASRAAVQQVVGNLLVNAAESIRESGVEEGRIQIYAANEAVDGTPMAHFRFEDNGMGIKEEDLDHIFERDFSTKGRNSGLGLHWSANTVNALKGLLYAKNDGVLSGACLHLHLPLAVEHHGDNPGYRG